MTTTLLLAVCLISQRGTPSADFRSFASAEGMFTAKIPGKPATEVTTTNTSWGAVQFHGFVLDREEATYVVRYADYPASIAKVDPGKILDEARDTLVAESHGKRLAERRVTRGQAPGEEFEFVATDAAGARRMGRARLFLAGRRLYQISIIGPERKTASEKTDRYLESLRIVAPAQAAKAQGKPAASASPTSGAFRSAEGRFSIVFPAKPKEEEVSAPSPIGTIQVHTYSVETANDVFVVVYNDFPAAALNIDPHKLLDGAATGAVGNVKGAKMLAQRDTSLGEYPGKAFEFALPSPKGGKGLAKVRFYLAGRRLYQVMYMGSPTSAQSPLIEQYLNSFRVEAPEPRARLRGAPNRRIMTRGRSTR